MKDGAGCGGRQNVTLRLRETDDFGSQVYERLSIKTLEAGGCKLNQCFLMRSVPSCRFLWLGNVTFFFYSGKTFCLVADRATRASLGNLHAHFISRADRCQLLRTDSSGLIGCFAISISRALMSLRAVSVSPQKERCPCLRAFLSKGSPG